MDSTVLVTGAGRGLGAAIARELARRGHHVVVNHRGGSERADRIVAEIREAGGSALAARADVTDPEKADALVGAALAGTGRLDAVVFAANTAPPPFAPLAELSWKAFGDKVTGELEGVFHLTKAALEHLRTVRGGRLVYLGSTAADYVGGGRIAHGTAKSALATFARHVAAETARDGIGVLTVAPGAVRTESTAAHLDAERIAALGRESVLGRMLEPRDIAKTVALAVDPDALIATGSTLRVDAGWSVLVGGPSA